MSENKEKENALVQIMITKGYDVQNARKCVDDVLDARRLAREFELKNYVGKRVKAEFGGLIFDVIVRDVKLDYDGKAQFQVTPLNGSKSAWVKNIGQ